MPVPKRGEVWLVNLGMAAKTRPCLVMSVAATAYNRAGDLDYMDLSVAAKTHFMLGHRSPAYRRPTRVPANAANRAVVAAPTCPR